MCAGIIAGVLNNSNCGVGLAYKASIGGELNPLSIFLGLDALKAFLVIPVHIVLSAELLCSSNSLV